ncbi:MAG TPA: DegV family protein [Thermoleophilia bacterium]|nr:DegV family protein [Thermoleophilia bacterium]
MTVRIVTDSSSCLPPGWAEENGVSVIPQGIVVDGTAYRENVDLSGDEFYRLLEWGSTATSSQPRPDAFVTAYRAALDAGDEMVSVHIGSDLSGTLDAAYSHAAGLRTPDSPARIHLVDSCSAGLGLGFLVVEAARLAAEGAEALSIVTALEAMVPKIRVYFMLHTMTYLVRGGRVGRAAGLAASLLKLRPILTINDGEIAPAARTRTPHAAAAQLWALIDASARRGVRYAGFHYGLNRDEVDGWRQEFTRRYGLEAWLTQLGPAVGAHSGPRVLGVVLVEE